ncbi:MAG: hypothetical protein COV29_03930 [Candidatus Yanofskybacteria bacterium CG10_big_fil_rev_8_21_14_0_10_36_16]|uniref:phenylalanine--tRNA ligase n=1 Tax=Candidatus Yanofskybacteria bacterium CG10_big_fil_rev_8_21_14_0_10_36_16 TaxID=1975096 RepID=A0A2J0Q6N6_9BACT|nr:MAG: hypothetical protein COV29_03930 [Candidatus Yanofskybacteria bacterium CG10_big_fil_rev_8_21_14_0_10_36_16]
MEIKIDYEKEKQLREELSKKDDPDSKRLKRFLDMPDLTRTPGSPIHEITKRIIDLPDFKDFDTVEAPEIVPADISFDLFNFPEDHPARSKSDTYYADDKNILRTHTTVMWYYYLMNEKIRERIKNLESIGSLSHGKVYRKDEIDRNHMNVFHQMDGWYLTPRDKKVIGIEDLQDVLVKIAQAVFGKDIKYRFNQDEFPYTDPSVEMEVEVGPSTNSGQARWIEVLGSGIVRGVVLEKLDVDSKIYNGWAFGFGLERLAIISMDLPDIRLLWSDDSRVKKQLKLGKKFKEVSKYPPITRDISFIVSKDFVPNNYFDLIRDLGGDLIEEVQLIDKYEDDSKFGKDKMSYTYRIIYRSMERTLTNEEVDEINDKVYEQTKSQFQAELR